MPDYERLYFQLFAATADTVEAMERLDFTKAEAILIAAQGAAEEMYLQAEDRE